MSPINPITDVNNPLVHLHIPKTGGSSLLQLWYAWFGKERLMRIDNYKPGSDFSVLWGHFANPRNRGVDRLVPCPRRLVTFIRNPFDQALSTYYYLTAEQSNPMNMLGRHYEFENVRDFIENGPADMQLEFMPRREYPVGLKDFFFVGCVDHMQKCATALGKLFGKHDVVIPHVLRSKYSEGVPRDLEDAFKQKNKASYVLYEWVKEYWDSHDSWDPSCLS